MESAWLYIPHCHGAYRLIPAGRIASFPRGAISLTTTVRDISHHHGATTYAYSLATVGGLVIGLWPLWPWSVTSCMHRACHASIIHFPRSTVYEHFRASLWYSSLSLIFLTLQYAPYGPARWPLALRCALHRPGRPGNPFHYTHIDWFPCTAYSDLQRPQRHSIRSQYA